MTEYTIATLVFVLCCVVSGAAILIFLAAAITAAVRGSHLARVILGCLGLYAFVFAFFWSTDVLF